MWRKNKQFFEKNLSKQVKKAVNLKKKRRFAFHLKNQHDPASIPHQPPL